MHKVKRRHERLPTNRPLAVQVPEWSGLEAVCRDISYGGACLVIPEEVRVGDRLVFELAIPSAGDATVTGLVRHVTQLADGRFVVGVAWGLPGEQQSELMKAYVDGAA